MTWKLSKWKDCDGGCCVRAPRFPRDPENPSMSDCVYHENGPGGDGDDVRGGCRLIRELNSADLIPVTEVLSKGKLLEMQGRQEPPHGPWAKRPLQWFLDTCWGWPVRPPNIMGLLQRMKSVGRWDDTDYSPGFEYDKVYTDEEIQGQTFHVTSDMSQVEKEAQEPACCHYWEEVDA